MIKAEEAVFPLVSSAGNDEGLNSVKSLGVWVTFSEVENKDKRLPFLQLTQI